MLSESEHAAFNDIAARLGPLDEPAPPYLMPWWMPPGILAFYGMLMTVAGFLYSGEALLVIGLLVTVASVHWARHRRRQAPRQSTELSYLNPFIR